MPHYMVQWSYEPPEIKSMVQRPQNRADTIRPAVEAYGGNLLCFFYAFGDYDGVAILEFPDNVSIAAFLMSVFQSSALSSAKTTVLLSPEDGFAAMESARESASQFVKYVPPSG